MSEWSCSLHFVANLFGNSSVNLWILPVNNVLFSLCSVVVWGSLFVIVVVLVGFYCVCYCKLPPGVVFGFVFTQMGGAQFSK